MLDFSCFQVQSYQERVQECKFSFAKDTGIWNRNSGNKGNHDTDLFSCLKATGIWNKKSGNEGRHESGHISFISSFPVQIESSSK